MTVKKYEYNKQFPYTLWFGSFYSKIVAVKLAFNTAVIEIVSTKGVETAYILSEVIPLHFKTADNHLHGGICVNELIFSKLKVC